MTCVTQILPGHQCTLIRVFVRGFLDLHYSVVPAPQYGLMGVFARGSL